MSCDLRVQGLQMTLTHNPLVTYVNNHVPTTSSAPLEGSVPLHLQRRELIPIPCSHRL